MSEASKDEFVFWEFDILSSLSVSMKSDDWKMFMQNFVLSFCDTLPTVLFDIYETLGLNIPPEILPPGYNDNDDEEKITLPVKIKKPKKQSNEKQNEVEIVEKPVPRTFITYDVSLREVPLKRKSRKSESSRRKSNGSNVKEEKKSSSKKSRRRNSLVLDTPNHKDYVSSRHERAINLAQKKIKRSNSTAYSPIPNRTPSTPTALRHVRSVYAISDNKLRRLLSPKNKDQSVEHLEDAERSLTQFSNESFDILGHSRSSMQMKPVTRFKSRLSSSFISPHKTENKETSHQINALSFSNQSPKSNDIISPRKTTPQKRCTKFFSPVKTTVNSPSKRKSPIKASIKSPSKSNKVNYFSPVKHQNSKTDSPIITVTESNPNKTPLKSCLKSPLPDRIWNLRDNHRSVKRRSTALGLSASVLMSPKVKRRLYMTNQPPQDFCEETMFMNHKDFVELSGNKCHQTDQIGIVDSDFLSDNSASSNFSSPNNRVLLFSKQHLNPTRQLFGNLSSDIDTKNILSASRRSMVPIPNFNNSDPETDISNSLKF